jgi:hypothetical protein
MRRLRKESKPIHLVHKKRTEDLGESPVMRKYHAGFGREGACFLLEAIPAWQRTLTSEPIMVRLKQRSDMSGSSGYGRKCFDFTMV